MDQLTFVDSPECAPEGPRVGTVFLLGTPEIVHRMLPKRLKTVDLNSRAILVV